MIRKIMLAAALCACLPASAMADESPREKLFRDVIVFKAVCPESYVPEDKLLGTARGFNAWMRESGISLSDDNRVDTCKKFIRMKNGGKVKRK